MKLPLSLTVQNTQERKLMDKPSIESDLCAFCGAFATNRHHIIPRSRGGKSGPTVSVCGNGNTSGCHGRLHDRTLHLDWRDGEWHYLRTLKPTKTFDALELDGWQPLRTQYHDKPNAAI